MIFDYIRSLRRSATIFSANHAYPTSHYYGDLVRRYFIAGAIIMLISFPFVYNRLTVSIYVGIFIIITVGFLQEQQIQSKLLVFF